MYATMTVAVMYFISVYPIPNDTKQGTKDEPGLKLHTFLEIIPEKDVWRQKLTLLVNVGDNSRGSGLGECLKGGA